MYGPGGGLESLTLGAGHRGRAGPGGSVITLENSTSRRAGLPLADAVAAIRAHWRDNHQLPAGGFELLALGAGLKTRFPAIPSASPRGVLGRRTSR